MKTLQIVGPFFTNYSLARVNRGLALALSKVASEYEVKIHGDKESLDYYPSDEELSKKTDLYKLFQRERKESDFVIYNNFPKSLNNPHGLKDLPSRIKIMYVAWEESVYPIEWVEEINTNLHAVFAASTFTKNILQRAGVKIPIYIVPNALDDDVMKDTKKVYELNTKKKFKFLHVSSAKRRKGIDVLLKAYFEEFDDNDDVCLVIKSFPGPDNSVDELIKELKKENSPEVIHINNPDLTDEELRALHNACDAEVYPTRAEGFGLPILEAMHAGNPVITTNYSGHLDFCNEENSYLIDYELEYAKDSEFTNIGAVWAEPDLEDLKRLMKEVFEGKEKDELKEKVARAKTSAKRYTWENSAKIVTKALEEIEDYAPLKNKKIAVVTPYNNQSGIFVYSEDLYKNIESSFADFFYVSNSDIADRFLVDKENVVRTWKTTGDEFDETMKFLKENSIEIVHIQYHSGAYTEPDVLDIFIEKLKKASIQTYVTLHAVRGDSFDFIKSIKRLNEVNKVIIHNSNDFEYAKKTLDNVYLMNLPTNVFEPRNKKKLKEKLEFKNASPIVATHGLLNTNKNVPEIISAVTELKKDYPDILLLCLSAVSSNNIHASNLLTECQELIKKNSLESNVVMFTDFLDERVIFLLLQASDVIIFNYSDVGESASAAVRKGLTSGNPVITTAINMFGELKDEVLKIDNNSSENVAKGIRKVLEDDKLKAELVRNAKRYIEENSYEKRAIATLLLYSSKLG